MRHERAQRKSSLDSLSTRHSAMTHRIGFSCQSTGLVNSSCESWAKVTQSPTMSMWSFGRQKLRPTRIRRRPPEPLRGRHRRPTRRAINHRFAEPTTAYIRVFGPGEARYTLETQLGQECLLIGIAANQAILTATPAVTGCQASAYRWYVALISNAMTGWSASR